MATLWDTTSGEIVKALSVERRAAGAVAFGIVLTLVVVVDERHAQDAMAEAITGTAAHPCRLLVVSRRLPDAASSRLDAEVTVGGRLGPGEAIVLRMHGRLARHAESAVLPLLAPDTPVVTWWYAAAPQRVNHDPLGALANRRITDAATASDPLRALRDRAADYHPGDTDLSWTRLTLWRSALAAAYDSVTGTAQTGRVEGEPDDPSVPLLAGWLRDRLDIAVDVGHSRGPGVTLATIELRDEGEPTRLAVHRPDGRMARLCRTGQPDRILPLPQRGTADLLAEELRRLDADQIYASALATATGRRPRPVARSA